MPEQHGPVNCYLILSSLSAVPEQHGPVNYYLILSSLSAVPEQHGPVARPPTVQAWVYYAVRLINCLIFFSN